MEILYSAESLNRELKKLIFLAKGKITLVSPFLKIDKEMASILKEKRSQGNMIQVFTRAGHLNFNIDIRDCVSELYNFPRLHTKMYLSESEVIFASANLYDSSLQNNHEMGLCFSKEWDLEAYQKLCAEVEFFSRCMPHGLGAYLIWKYEESNPQNALQHGSYVSPDQLRHVLLKCGITANCFSHVGIHRVENEIYIFCKKSSVKGVYLKKESHLYKDYVIGEYGIGHFQCKIDEYDKYFDNNDRIKADKINIVVDNIYYEESEIYNCCAPQKNSVNHEEVVGVDTYDRRLWTIVLCHKEEKDKYERVKIKGKKEECPAAVDVDESGEDIFPSRIPRP